MFDICNWKPYSTKAVSPFQPGKCFFFLVWPKGTWVINSGGRDSSDPPPPPGFLFLPWLHGHYCVFSLCGSHTLSWESKRKSYSTLRIKSLQQKVQWSVDRFFPPTVVIIGLLWLLSSYRCQTECEYGAGSRWNPYQNILGGLLLSVCVCVGGCIVDTSPPVLCLERYNFPASLNT